MEDIIIIKLTQSKLLGAAYRYEVLHTGSDGVEYRLYDGQAATAKPAGVPFAFFVLADSGTGKRHQFRLAWAMNQYPTDLILHAGDLVYGKGEAHDYPKKSFWPYRELISRIPFYPVLGNQDVTTDNGQSFLDTFVLAKDAVSTPKESAVNPPQPAYHQAANHAIPSFTRRAKTTNNKPSYK